MANYKKKKMWKTIGIIAGIVAFLVALGALSGGVLSSLRERNPDNLIKVDEGYIETIKNTDHGLSVDVWEDGTIHIKGDPSADEQLIVKTFTLEAGTYTISGLEKPDLNKMVLGVKWGTDGSVSTAYAGLKSATFTLAEATEVTVFIDIFYDAEETEIVFANRWVRPVIVAGEDAGEFYK